VELCLDEYKKALSLATSAVCKAAAHKNLGENIPSFLPSE